MSYLLLSIDPGEKQSGAALLDHKERVIIRDTFKMGTQKGRVDAREFLRWVFDLLCSPAYAFDPHDPGHSVTLVTVIEWITSNPKYEKKSGKWLLGAGTSRGAWVGMLAAHGYDRDHIIEVLPQTWQGKLFKGQFGKGQYPRTADEIKAASIRFACQISGIKDLTEHEADAYNQGRVVMRLPGERPGTSLAEDMAKKRAKWLAKRR
jgi:hypothetical protein